MKKILLTFAMAFVVMLTSFAQSPQVFKYQAVARDLSGNILATQAVSFQISILQGSATGSSVYTETHATTTNSFGLVNLEIGNGTLISGDFTTIDWGTNSYFVQIEMDETGGTSYNMMGTSQLLSVPYALYAENSGDTTKWKLNGDSLYYNNGNVGINTLSPRAYLHVNSSSNKTALLIENTGTTSAKVVLNQAGSANGQAHYLVSRNDGNFVIGNASNGIADQFILDSLGNVGIGTSSPETALEIVGDIQLQPSNGIRWNSHPTDNNIARYSIHVPNFPGAPIRVATDLDPTTQRHFEVGYYTNSDPSDTWNMTLDVIPVAKKVNISDVLNLTPRSAAPSGPTAGDIYFNSTTNKLMVYDGSTWQACW